ncbi:MAG: hypothetical protein OXI70_11895 [Chloroflexota bacterium]|nr:hypothetical protein [Chloroflexota bacterium]
MKGYMKLTAALAAFALLLVVMGLSTANTVNAQAPGTITVPNKYLCSLATCADATTPADGTNHSGDITVQDPGTVTTVEVLNLDVARVSVTDTDDDSTVSINPRTITIGTAITVVQEFTDADSDNVPDAGQIRAFNGNRIQITFRPTSGFATTATILVDNVKPILVTNSPDIPLVVKGNTNVVFSADLTDGGSGYTSTVGTTNATADIDDKNGTPGILGTGTPANTTTPIGGVRLVVAGNVVNLTKDNFTKIDGGWTVSAELGSSAIQNIGANVPWYFETRGTARATRAARPAALRCEGR